MIHDLIGSVHMVNADCMELLASYPDKAFNIAIVDPPYGIDIMHGGGKPIHLGFKQYTRKNWDKERPGEKYFNELFRVSENQIIWGGNYFTQYLPSSMGWIYWDKGQKLTTSDGELAYTSFQRALRSVCINRCHIKDFGGVIHPTQKPVNLYAWILQNYAKPGDKILDTHNGSGSINIACDMLGYDITAVEIDSEYYNNAKKRLIAYKKQLKLF